MMVGIAGMIGKRSILVVLCFFVCGGCDGCVAVWWIDMGVD